MKRIAGIFLAALLALTVLPHGAELVTSDDVTKGIVTTAYAKDVLGSGQVSIGGMVLDGSNTKYYKNGGTVGSASDYDAKFENGVLTLNELELTGQIVSNGDLTIVVHAKGATIDYTTTETGKAAIQVEGNLKVKDDDDSSIADGELNIHANGADAINATGNVTIESIDTNAIATDGSGIVAGGNVVFSASVWVRVEGTYGVYSKASGSYSGIEVYYNSRVIADAAKTGLYVPDGRIYVWDNGKIYSTGQEYGVCGKTVSVGNHMIAIGGIAGVEGTLIANSSISFIIKSGETARTATEKTSVNECASDKYVLILREAVAYCTIRLYPGAGTGTQEEKQVLWGTGCNTLPDCMFTAPSGKIFAGWSLEWGGESIDSLSAEQTMVNYVTLYATWKTDDGGKTKYALTVNNGTGSGEYVEGEVVTIAANPAAANHSFYMWDGAEGLEFVDGTSANKSTVKFKMPNHAVTLTAKYLDTSVLQVIIDPNGGEFTDSVVVTLKPSKELTPSTSKIYYTTDGSHPATSETRMEYTGPFTLTESCKVIASIYRVNIGASEPSDPPTDTKYADFVIKKDSGGETGGETAEHKHPVCGGSNCTDSTHADETFQKWESTTSLPASGKYYLANNVTLASSHDVTGDLVLCLNGKTVTAKKDGIIVPANSTFTLTDCKPDGKDGCIGGNGWMGVTIRGDGRFILYAGKIEKFNTGLEVLERGTFTMYGGTIADNNASGVVVQDGGNAVISGGTVTGNSTGVTLYGEALTVDGNAVITGNSYNGIDDYGTLTIGGNANITENGGSLGKINVNLVSLEGKEPVPITVRNDFNGKFGLTTSLGEGAKVINGVVKGTITCDSSRKTIDADGKIWKATSVPVKGVVLNKQELSLTEDDAETLIATVMPTDATNKNVTWHSGDTSVATVVDGAVTAVSAGTTTITVTTEDGGKAACCIVTVTEAQPGHVHVKGERTYDENGHWFKCTGCNEKLEYAVHQLNADGKCECGYVKQGDTPTPTPTPEAPRYYYSSGSGSTGAGGLSAVQNDPNGKSATDYSGGIYGLLFRTNAALSAFRGVQVDGVTIDAANYSVEGNEVYLKAVYLQTLANGKHTLTVLSGEGDATAQFTVGGVVSAPKTADAGALAYLGLALSSYVGTALVTRRKKEF